MAVQGHTITDCKTPRSNRDQASKGLRGLHFDKMYCVDIHFLILTSKNTMCFYLSLNFAV